MDFTHITSFKDQQPLHAMATCKGIPVLISVPREKPTDITLLNGENRSSTVQPLAVLSGHRSPVVHLCVSEDSDWLFSVSNDVWLLWRINSCLQNVSSVQASQLSGGDPSSVSSFIVSCFNWCSSHLFVSTEGGAFVIETMTGVCTDINPSLLTPDSNCNVLCAVYCDTLCAVAIGLDNRTFRVCDLENCCVIYQSCVFPATFTSLSCTANYLTMGTSSGKVKIFSLSDLLNRSCDTLLHDISLSHDLESHDRVDIDESVVDLYTYEDNNSVSVNGTFLIAVIRRCGLVFINGYNADVLTELCTEDPVSSLVDPNEPQFSLPIIHTTSVTRRSHDQLLCSISAVFDGVVSVLKIVISGCGLIDSKHEEISVVSSCPLSGHSVLQSPPLIPALPKPHPSGGTRGRGGGPTAKDQPLTFKSKIRSSGYTQQPRMTMFKPRTDYKQSKPSTKQTTTASGSIGLPVKCIGNVCHDYTGLSLTDRLLLPEQQPIRNCLYTGNGSHLLYTVGKTLYAMKPHPSPTPVARHTPFNGHDNHITCISGSHDNQWALTCSADKTAKLWRVNPCTQQPLMNISTVVHNYKEPSSTATSNHRDNSPFPSPLSHCSFYYLDKFIILGYSNKINVMKYHLDTDKSHDIKRYLTKSHYKRVVLISLDPSVKSLTTLSTVNDFYSYLLYVAGSDRSLHVYDMNQMKWVWSVSDAHKRPVHSIVQNKGSITVTPTVSHDLFVTSAVGEGLKLWDTRTQRCVRWYTSHCNPSQPLSTCFSPCGRYIATGSEDRMVYLYDIRHLSPVSKLVCKTSVVSTVQFHPYKSQLVCSSLEGEMNFFEENAQK